MSASTASRTPSLRRHKASNQGYVELDGRLIYLGRYDLPETQAAYHRQIAEWVANGRRLAVTPEECTVAELLLAYWLYVEKYYVNSAGKPTGEVVTTKHALRRLRQLYATVKVSEFGPRALKAVRQHMVDSGWCRNGVNAQIGRIRRCFRWGVENELVPPSVYHGLQAVAALKRGRCDALESDPVKPVPQHHINLVLERVSRQVGALIQLQLLTGARSGEILTLRPIDFDLVYVAEEPRTKENLAGWLLFCPILPASRNAFGPMVVDGRRNEFPPAQLGHRYIASQSF